MGTAIKRPVPAIVCNFWHLGTLTLSPERQSTRQNYKCQLNLVSGRQLVKTTSPTWAREHCILTHLVSCFKCYKLVLWHVWWGSHSFTTRNPGLFRTTWKIFQELFGACKCLKAWFQKVKKTSTCLYLVLHDCLVCQTQTCLWLTVNSFPKLQMFVNTDMF